MLKRFFIFSFLFISIAGHISAQTDILLVDSSQTLLWKISGRNLSKPSYLYGTIHILCEEDAGLSANALQAINDADAIYLEADLDNMQEMMDAMREMKMKNGVTLKSLLSAEEYEKVKKYFYDSGQGMVFSMMENFKPLMLSTMMQVKTLGCNKTVAVEQLIMNEASKNKKEIKGLETMAYQASLFDSIPYDIQAKQLLDVVNNVYDVNSEAAKMMAAYKQQDLKAIDAITKDEKWGMDKYLDLLIYKRNKNWVQKLQSIMAEKSIFIAVGAGHLPGEQGVITLLQREGFVVTPVKNK